MQQLVADSRQSCPHFLEQGWWQCCCSLVVRSRHGAARPRQEPSSGDAARARKESALPPHHEPALTSTEPSRLCWASQRTFPVPAAGPLCGVPSAAGTRWLRVVPPRCVCVSWGISLCWQPPSFQHCSQRLLGILAFALAAAVCSSCLWLVPHCRTNSIPIESTIWLQARPANCC